MSRLRGKQKKQRISVHLPSAVIAFSLLALAVVLGSFGVHRLMVFDILIRMKTNRAEYNECPIVPVVEQTLHGTHGWSGETSHTIHRVVFVLWPPCHRCRTVVKAPPHSVCFRAYAARYTLRQCNPVGAPLAVALAARLPIFPIGKIKKIFWGHPNPRARGIRPLRIPGCTVRWLFKIKRDFGDTPIPAQGTSPPYVSLITQIYLIPL